MSIVAAGCYIAGMGRGGGEEGLCKMRTARVHIGRGRMDGWTTLNVRQGLRGHLDLPYVERARLLGRAE